MVVTSVSKTTIFGRILFVLMVFILAFGGVFFYQYYNKTKDLKNTPSVSLSGNTTTANGILSNKDDEIILHATLDASDAIVTWHVPSESLFDVSGRDTNNLKLTLKNDYNSATDQRIDVEATIPGVTGKNASTKYPVILQKSSADTPRISYVTSGPTLQVGVAANEYVYTITAEGGANLSALAVDPIPGINATITTVGGTSTVKFKLDSDSPAASGLYKTKFKGSNFDPVEVDIAVMAAAGTSSLAFKAFTGVVAGRVSTGTISVTLYDVPSTATFNWTTATVPTGVSPKITPTVVGTVATFEYTTTAAVTAGTKTMELQATFGDKTCKVNTSFYVATKPTVAVKVTTTTDDKVGQIQVKNAAQKAKITVSSPVADATGYPLVISGAANIAPLPAYLGSSGWSVSGTGANTTVVATINWIDAGTSALAEGTSSIEIKAAGDTTSVKDNLFEPYTFNLQVMGERKVTSTVTGFLTAGSTSKNATITVALKNGVVTADLKVPAVAGLAFDTSWTDVTGTNTATIKVGLATTDPHAVGTADITIEPDTDKISFPTETVSVSIINIPDVATPVVVGVTDGVGLQIGKTTADTLTATFTAINTIDDTAETSMEYRSKAAGGTSLILNYVDVDAPAFDDTNSVWTSAITLKSIPLSPVIPGTYQIVYNFQAIDKVSATHTISATIDVTIIDIPAVKSFTLEQTGTMTMGEGTGAANQITITAKGLNKADLTNLAVDTDSVAGSEDPVLFTYTSWTTAADGSRSIVAKLGTGATAGSFNLTIKDTTSTSPLASVSLTLVIAPAKAFTMSVSGALTLGDTTTGVTVTATGLNGLDISGITSILTPAATHPDFLTAGTTVPATWTTNGNNKTLVLKDKVLTTVGMYDFTAKVGEHQVTIQITVVPKKQIILEQAGTLQIGVPTQEIVVTAIALYGTDLTQSAALSGTLLENNLVATPAFVVTTVDPNKGTATISLGTAPVAGTYTLKLTANSVVSNTLSVVIKAKKALQATLSNTTLQIGASSVTSTITVTGLNGAVVTTGQLPNLTTTTDVAFTAFTNGVCTASLGSSPVVGAHEFTISSAAADTDSTTITINIVDKASVVLTSSGTLQVGKAASTISLTATALNMSTAPVWNDVQITGATSEIITYVAPVATAGNANVATTTISLGSNPVAGIYTLSFVATSTITVNFDIYIQPAQYMTYSNQTGVLQVGETTSMSIDLKAHEGASLASLTSSSPAGVTTSIGIESGGIRTATISLDNANPIAAGSYKVTFRAADAPATPDLDFNFTILPAKSYDAELFGQLQVGKSTPMTLELSAVNGFDISTTNFTKDSITIKKGAVDTDLSTSKFAVSDPVVSGGVTRFTIIPLLGSNSPAAGTDYALTITPIASHQSMTLIKYFTIAPVAQITLSLSTPVMQFAVNDEIVVTANGTYDQLLSLDTGDLATTKYKGLSFVWNALADNATTRTGRITQNPNDLPAVGSYDMTFKSTTNLFAPATIVFAIRHNDDSITYKQHMYSQTDYTVGVSGSTTITLTSSLPTGGFYGGSGQGVILDYQIRILDYATLIGDDFTTGNLDAVPNRVKFEETTVYGSSDTDVSDTATFLITTNDTAIPGTVYVVRINSPTKYMETIYIRITIVA